MSATAGPVEACSSANHHGEHEWYAPGGLRRYCPGDPVSVEIKSGTEWSDVSGMVSEPVTVEKGRTVDRWRFDVPEVPAHVTAVKDYEGEVFVRDPHDDGCWRRAGHPDSYRLSTNQLLLFFPLVECEDPRAAS